MDRMTLIGIVLIALSIYFGAPDFRADWTRYFQLDSFFLVFGGTMASTFISLSLESFQKLIKDFKSLIKPNNDLPTSKEVVQTLVKISEKAQSSSRSSLSQLLEENDHPFLKRALSLVSSGLDPEFIEETLNTEIIAAERSYNGSCLAVRSMGSYAPMFGMAGTVIGIIQVLKNVSDIETIVSGMGLALLTTLYGLFLSSVFFIPMAAKLQALTHSRTLTLEIIREGIMMIMDKEIPLKVRKYLEAFIEKEDTNDQESK